MNTYSVIWFYIGNHGVNQVEAESMEDALKACLKLYDNDNFNKKAKFMIVKDVLKPQSADYILGLD